METLGTRLPHSLYAAKQVKRYEAEIAAQLQIPLYQLMENAGAAVWQLIMQEYANHDRLFVFCGKGNNGGDGYVVARLALQAGREVSVIQYPQNAQLQGDAKRAQEAFVAAGGIIELGVNWAQIDSHAVIVDALLGTGIEGAITGEWADTIAHINQSQARRISVDLPSGLHADTGTVASIAVNADHTVSFVALKLGLVTAVAREYCGQLWFAGLGIAAVFEQEISPSAYLLLNQPTLPRRHQHAHKGDFGHVWVIGGQSGMSGAVRLAGEAALRSGTGLVTVITEQGNGAVISATRPELMVKEHDWSMPLPDLTPAVVIAIGPGLGTSDNKAQWLAAVIDSDKPAVVDADALNVLAASPIYYDHWVLTPHPGEAGRLLGLSSAEVNQDRYAAAKAIAQKYGGVCLLKGAGTIISDGNYCFVNYTGNPGMASAGMGDTLTGIIAALIAQGLSLIDAACQGATIHGAAADEAAKEGQIGLMATDVIKQIRRVINE